MEKLTKIKWISGNTPVIIVNRNDARLYLTKQELLDLKAEITDFINYYNDDFSKAYVNNNDPTIDETDLEINWTKLED